MVKMTQSLMQWLFQNGHADKIPLIGFGHTELLAQEMYNEYLKWVQTEEGRQYLKGGSKYKPELDPTREESRNNDA